MGKRTALVFFLLFGLVAGVQAADSTMTETAWQIDAVHSNVGFEVTHLVISKTEGEFNDYTAELQFDPKNLGSSSAKVTIMATSIDTDNENRDKHLRSADFFDVENHPEITFVSKKVTKTGDNTFTLTGDLSIKGATKEVTLDGKMSGPITGPWGNERAGISLKGAINRLEYGVSWNKTLDTGGLVVSDEVEISIELELVKAAKS